ncbi:hypothetical protein E2562_033982 [Oryza meyeriana var. granulata]|uniref:Uncharacterized protein n=1 Tax=Oryza meyeriana var. granulata TaxID=110450 RepID=A0A6G1ES87_9ORYZ|nr:hypothetical protein E2562_033982 [Oryza meyeriana var. granulata]
MAAGSEGLRKAAWSLIAANSERKAERETASTEIRLPEHHELELCQGCLVKLAALCLHLLS